MLNRYANWKIILALPPAKKVLLKDEAIILIPNMVEIKKLIALYEQKGCEYFEKYFTYTLLEYFGLSYDPIKVLERKQYWK